MFRVTAGAARGIEGATGRHSVEQSPHGRLLHSDQRVARLVVGGRPGRIPLAHVHLGRGQREGEGGRFGLVDEALHLRDAGRGLLVVTDQQPPQQGQTLDADEQVAQLDLAGAHSNQPIRRAIRVWAGTASTAAVARSV